MPFFIDLTNKKFARLLVINRDFSANRTAFFCQCDCGKVKSIRSAHLIDGKIQSCGCLHSERAAKRIYKMHEKNIKTGISNSPTYQSWCGMKQRCTNPRSNFFSYYGGRGIIICPRWIDSFENFLVDMGKKPHGHSLDRIDPNGNYEPNNCRWATRKQQQNNLRSNRVYEIYGRKLTISQMADLFDIKRSTLDGRISRGITIEKAVIPPKKRSID